MFNPGPTRCGVDRAKSGQRLETALLLSDAPRNRSERRLLRKLKSKAAAKMMVDGKGDDND